jgi:hypothetical protein
LRTVVRRDTWSQSQPQRSGRGERMRHDRDVYRGAQESYSIRR